MYAILFPSGYTMFAPVPTPQLIDYPGTSCNLDHSSLAPRKLYRIIRSSLRKPFQVNHPNAQYNPFAGKCKL